MDLVKAYRPESNSFSSGQVLQCAYDFKKARVVIQEMADAAALDLVSKKLVTDQLVLTVGYDIESLNRIFSELMDSLEEHPMVTVSYFKPDEHKAGGAYVTVTGQLKKVETYEQLMVMENGTAIPIGNIMDLQF